MIQQFDTIQKFGKDNVDAALKSFGAVSKGAQAIAVEAADYAKKSFEQSTATLEKLVGAEVARQGDRDPDRLPEVGLRGLRRPVDQARRALCERRRRTPSSRTRASSPSRTATVCRRAKLAQRTSDTERPALGRAFCFSEDDPRGAWRALCAACGSRTGFVEASVVARTSTASSLGIPALIEPASACSEQRYDRRAKHGRGLGRERSGEPARTICIPT